MKNHRKLKETAIKLKTEQEFLQTLLEGYLVEVPGFGRVECCERTGGRFLINDTYYPVFFDELKGRLDRCKVYHVTLTETPWHYKAAFGSVVVCKTPQGERVAVEILSCGRFLTSKPAELDDLIPLSLEEVEKLVCN
jgi:hypothetical protein